MLLTEQSDPAGRSAFTIGFFATGRHDGRCHGVSNTIPKRLEQDSLPRRIHDLAVPPRHLYLVGTLPTTVGIAVVGTRHPTREAVEYTDELVGALGLSGVAIWSGGAAGIDAAAHRAAMRVGAPTVVVAPAGWSRPYPPEHAELFGRIVERGGAYLSLVDSGCSAKQHAFFARNALLIALVHAVVIVQAGLRSGARNAAKSARNLGRPVFVAPSCPWVHEGLGCNLELGLGARVLNSPSEVVHAARGSGLPIPSTSTFRRFSGDCGRRGQGISGVPRATTTEMSTRGSAQQAQHGNDLEAELSLLVEAVRSGVRDVDSLCARTGLPAQVVQSDLLRLTLLGRIRTDRAGAVDIVSDR